MNLPDVSPAPLPRQRIYHILVVEDSATQALSLKFLLEAEGFKVSLAADGPEAIELAQLQGFETDPVDLIILDVELPTLNGYETCRRLKIGPLTTQIPIIMLTSRDRPIDTLAGLEAGGLDYIPKDAFAHAILCHRIRQINQGANL